MEKDDDTRIRYYQVPLMVSDMESLKKITGLDNAKGALQEAVDRVISKKKVSKKVE